MAQPQLPDPVIEKGAGLCVACGYSLAGLSREGRCPECRTEYAQEHLVLAGVPNSTKGTFWPRRVAWAMVLAGGFVYFQMLGLIIIRLSWIAAGVMLLILAGGVTWLLVTGPRERGGAERFIVTPAGIARVPLRPQAEGLDSALIPWPAGGRVELRRVSSVWKRMRIGHGASASGRPTGIVFDAGVRCPDVMAKDVLEFVGKFLARGAVGSKNEAGPGDAWERAREDR